jgi:hypothetical protein
LEGDKKRSSSLKQYSYINPKNIKFDKEAFFGLFGKLPDVNISQVKNIKNLIETKAKKRASVPNLQSKEPI